MYTCNKRDFSKILKINTEVYYVLEYEFTTGDCILFKYKTR